MPSKDPQQLQLFPPAADSNRGQPTQEARSASPPARLASERGRDRPSLVHRLQPFLHTPLRSVRLTRNRSRIVSASAASDGVGLDLRVHRCFALAEEPVLRAVAEFLEAPRGGSRRRRALAIIREHFRQHGEQDTLSQKSSLCPVGQRFDLRPIRDRINQKYFAGQLQVDITWGKARTHRRKRGAGFSIRLGSYHESDRLVRIHRVLDRPEVPTYVIESIVHHEMLHAVLPPVIRGDRRYVHTPEFRRREKEYERFEEAEIWLTENVERLARLR